MLQASVIHGLGLDWPPPLGISDGVTLGWSLTSQSPNKDAFLNLHLCVALLETRGGNRCVNLSTTNDRPARLAL